MTGRCRGQRRWRPRPPIWLRMIGRCHGRRRWRRLCRTWLRMTGRCHGRRRWPRLRRTWLRMTARCHGRRRWQSHQGRRRLRIWLQTTGRCHVRRRFHRPLQARCRTGPHGHLVRLRRRFSSAHLRSRLPARSSSSAAGGFDPARRRSRLTERRLCATALRAAFIPPGVFNPSVAGSNPARPIQRPKPALSPQRERSTQSGGGRCLSLLGGAENAVHGVEAVHHALEADKLRRNARRRKPSRVQLAFVP